MYSTILVPLDGSAVSERALPMAVSLAQAMRAEVILMRAASASVFPGADPTEAQIRAVSEAQTYLSALAAGLSDRGLRVEVAVPYGDAAESVLLEIDLRNADLVVMCTHGRSGLGRWIYGSVVEQVLAHSRAPILLVRPSGEATVLGSESAPASLLVPLDGSAFSEVALPHARDLAHAFDGNITLLRVVERAAGIYSSSAAAALQSILEQEHRAAAIYVDALAEQLRADGLRAETIVREGFPADIIVFRAAALGAGLIVMATRGHTGLAGTLMGSVALEVIRRSLLPVLLIRPPVPLDSVLDQGSGVQKGHSGSADREGGR